MLIIFGDFQESTFWGCFEKQGRMRFFPKKAHYFLMEVNIFFGDQNLLRLYFSKVRR